VVTRVDWAYRSEAAKDALNFPQLTQEGFSLLDLGMTWISPQGTWEVSVFGKNVTDERYVVSGHANGLTQGWATAVVGRPAEWGLSVSYNFGD
jgi:iron complex outermembrane receptor protein